MRIIFMPLVLTLLPAAAPSPTVPVYRIFGKWAVACDNVRTCIARGFDEGVRAELDLVRAAGDDRGRLVFSAETPFALKDMRLDGKPLSFAAGAWSEKDGAATANSPEAVAGFIAAVRNGDSLTLDAAPAGDDTPRTVPLAGFSAALLLVDAVQGRAGTPGALIAAKGHAAPPAAPALPAAPHWVVPPALTADETQRLMKQAAVLPSPAFGSCDVKDGPDVYPLDAQHALAIRPCYLAAYQGSSVVAVLLRAGGPAAPVVLALPGLPENATDGPDMVDPVFDPATGKLETVSKGRGLADCGSEESWVWSEGRFRLAALSYQAMCGGTEAGDWPVLYRTR